MAMVSNLYIDAGADYAAIVTAKARNGQPIKLIGFTVKSQIRKHYESAHAFDFNATSDERKKTDIQTASSNIVQRLRGVEFKWSETGNQSSGVIAQEVEAVIPHAVNTDEDGFKSVNYNSLIAYLIEGMKEQQKQIDELKAALNK